MKAKPYNRSFFHGDLIHVEDLGYFMIVGIEQEYYKYFRFSDQQVYTCLKEGLEQNYSRQVFLVKRI